MSLSTLAAARPRRHFRRLHRPDHSGGGTLPPKTWVDKDTGHRVWRLSDEPNSGGFYFNVNAYTPDGKQMIYTAPDGIHVLDMATRADATAGPQPAAPRRCSAPPVRRPAASGGVHALVVGYQDQQRLLHPDRSGNRRHLRLQGRHQHRRNPQARRPARTGATSSASTPTRRWPPEPISRATPPARSTAQNVPAPAAACRARPTIASPAPSRGRITSPPTRAQMMERRLAARLPLRALHHPSRARPQRREARRHQGPAPLHRLGQPPALFAHRSRRCSCTATKAHGRRSTASG